MQYKKYILSLLLVSATTTFSFDLDFLRWNGEQYHHMSIATIPAVFTIYLASAMTAIIGSYWAHIEKNLN